MTKMIDVAKLGFYDANTLQEGIYFTMLPWTLCGLKE